MQYTCELVGLGVGGSASLLHSRPALLVSWEPEPNTKNSPALNSNLHLLHHAFPMRQPAGSPSTLPAPKDNASPRCISGQAACQKPVPSRSGSLTSLASVFRSSHAAHLRADTTPILLPQMCCMPPCPRWCGCPRQPPARRATSRGRPDALAERSSDAPR